MERKNEKYVAKKVSGWLSVMVFALILIFTLTHCREKDVDIRTTGIYGSVVDADGKPIDSVKVLVYGEWDYANKHDSPSALLLETYTDNLGNYDANLEVPEGFPMLRIVVPAQERYGTPLEGPFVPSSPEHVARENMGYAPVGEKSRIDFKQKAE